MTKKEILSIAAKCGWYECYEFPEEELLSFAKTLLGLQLDEVVSDGGLIRSLTKARYQKL